MCESACVSHRLLGGPISPHVPSYIDILRDGRVNVNHNTSVVSPQAFSEVMLSTITPLPSNHDLFD